MWSRKGLHIIFALQTVFLYAWGPRVIHGGSLRRVFIHNLSRTEVQPVGAWYCESFLCRLRGLTFRRSLEDDAGLLLVGERENRVDAAIHMLFVWFDIGVVWLDSSAKVVDTCLARSWRPFYIPQAPAQYILEIVPDLLERFRLGEQMRFEII